jgi:putative acetyltransferase
MTTEQYGNDVKLRTATHADVDAIASVHFAAVHDAAMDFYSRDVLDAWSRQPDERRYQQLREAVASPDEFFLVAEDPSGVIGFGSVAPASHELLAVYVHPRVGRRGVGKKILAGLEELAIGKGATFLETDASINAQEFYRRAGYDTLTPDVHRLQSGLEMACVRMAKRLGPAD